MRAALRASVSPLLAGALAAAAGCAALPAILPVAVPAGGFTPWEECAAVFPSGKFSVVHALEVSLPRLKKKSAVIGVTEGDNLKGRLTSVLLTPEGMTVFEATYEGGVVKVQRSLPPLDDPAFAARMFADVRLMLTLPPGLREAEGRLEDGRRACRYRDRGRVTDLVLERDGGFSVIDYGQGASAERLLRAHGPMDRGFPRRAELTVSGLMGYSLRFSLLRATRQRSN